MVIEATSSKTISTELPRGFVYLTDFLPDIQLDLRYTGTNNFIGRRIDGYVEPRAILTRQATEAVSQVLSVLRERGLGLKVFDTYRPQRAVDQFVRWTSDTDDKATKVQYYPDVDKGLLIESGYIAAQSSHSRGSTLDLTIVSMNSDVPVELDMGTPFDYFGPESWPESDAVTAVQRTHRMLLKGLMGDHGFKPLKEEWWHFTLGDEPFPDTYFDFPIE
jgi:D-alanyl-D-alanine dipeptidase